MRHNETDKLMTENKTLEMWQAYAQNKEDCDISTLPKVIGDSWQRSRTVQADPLLSDMIRIQEDELNMRRRKVKEFISSALPYLHKLFTLLKKDEVVITLADCDAVILEVLANPITYPEVSYPYAGTVHQENLIGTNAIGLSLHSDTSVRVYGSEHWRKSNHGWQCFATPLHLGSSLIGCINVACPIQSVDTSVPFFELTLSTANAIERELMLKRTIKDQEMEIQQQRTLLEFVDTGLIAIDKQGFIRQVNQQALDIFKVAGVWEGRNISELIKSDIDFESLKDTNRMLEEQNIAVKVGSKYLHITCSTYKVELDRLGIWLILLVRTSAKVREIVNKASGANARYSFSDIVGNCKAMEQPLKIAKLASKNSTNVLVMGETGTGKELLVQAIHNASERKNKPFLAINCAATSRELIRSELFGYEGGAFTSAKSTGSLGKFELADGGTLFLDEIGEMPLEVQSVLLRVLQTQEVVRIGGKYPIPINVRVIAATNRDLALSVQESTFRNDLYYRLNVLSINLPPLRKRQDDVVSLAKFFLKKAQEQFDKPPLQINPEVYEILTSYRWPGNIRELENVIQRAAVICEGTVITKQELPTAMLETDPGRDQDLQDTPIPDPGTKRSSSNIESIKKANLLKVLEEEEGNIRTVAARLDVSRGTIYNMMERYGLKAEEFRKK